MKKKLLTKQGLTDLKKELDTLLNIERQEVIEELQAARAQGDLSENADYDAAREKQAQIEGKIRELQYVLDNHKIIDNTPEKSKSGIKVGDTIKIKNIKSKKFEVYTIVGSFEVDPFNNKISNESPLAIALIGKNIGDEIKVKSIEPYKVKIIKVKS